MTASIQKASWLGRTVTTYYRADTEYRVAKRGRTWELSVRCDCVLGPHWHLVGMYDTKAAAEAEIGWPA